MLAHNSMFDNGHKFHQKSPLLAQLRGGFNLLPSIHNGRSKGSKVRI